jgi:cysteine desulfurase family protein
MYFDNAATSFPKPEAVYQTADRFFRTSAANPGRSGHRMAIEAERVIAQARHRLARLLNVPHPERLVWTSSCTEGLNLALKGLLRPGDRVVTTALEHNAVARPLRTLEKAGVDVVRVPCPSGRFELAGFRDSITPGTRLVAAVHASNVTGEVLPAEEIGARCQEVGATFVLDAAQTAGTLPLDLRGIGADLVAMPAHKGLLGPPGLGVLYIREGIDLPPWREGGTGSQSERDEQPEALPDRFESGTLNSVGIAGLEAALGWLLETGIEAVHRKEQELVRQLWFGLAEVPGITLYGPAPKEERAAVVSFNLENWEPTDAALVLDEQFDLQCRPGLHCAPWAHQSLGTFPRGTIRFSPGYFNTDGEVARAVAAVRRLAG